MKGCFQGSRQALGSEGSGRRAQRSGMGSSHICAGCEDELFGPPARQGLGGGRLELPCSGGWMGTQDPFFPMSTRLPSSSPPIFITPEGSQWMVWFKDSYFSTAEMPWTKPGGLWICYKMEQASWGGSGCTYPCPSLPGPACLSLGCPVVCCGRCGFFSFSFRNPTDHPPWLTVNKGLRVRATYKDVSWNLHHAMPWTQLWLLPRRWLAGSLDTSTTGLVEPCAELLESPLGLHQLLL